MSAHHLDFPICLRLHGKPVLLVGGGPIAEGRALQLLEAGARLRLVSPEASPALRQWAEEGRLEWHRRPYSHGDVRGHFIAFVATDELAVSQAVAAEARALGTWVNAADIPELCDFTVPSVGRRGPIVVAVSTNGQAPALARRLRQHFVAQVRPEHVRLARLTHWLRQRLPAGPARMRLLKGLVEGEVGQLLANGQRRTAWARLRAAIETLGEAT